MERKSMKEIHYPKAIYLLLPPFILLFNCYMSNRKLFMRRAIWQ